MRGGTWWGRQSRALAPCAQQLLRSELLVSPCTLPCGHQPPSAFVGTRPSSSGPAPTAGPRGQVSHWQKLASVLLHSTCMSDMQLARGRGLGHMHTLSHLSGSHTWPHPPHRLAPVFLHSWLPHSIGSSCSGMLVRSLTVSRRVGVRVSVNVECQCRGIITRRQN
jgi:hypothetical protein